MERILLLVDDTPESKTVVEWTLTLARKLKSRVIAAYIIDDRPPGSDREAEDQLAAIEEKAWQVLYEVEDDASDREIKVSLLLDQGKLLERLLELGRSYDVQLVVVGSRPRLPAGELVNRSPAPVLFVNESREV